MTWSLKTVTCRYHGKESVVQYNLYHHSSLQPDT